MSFIPFESTSGPGSDLETFAYLRKGYTELPPPKGIPFFKQGHPIPDFQQKHVQQEEVEQATESKSTNPLPFTRFVGTFHRQINQPGNLSVNEQIYLQ